LFQVLGWGIPIDSLGVSTLSYFLERIGPGPWVRSQTVSDNLDLVNLDQQAAELGSLADVPAFSGTLPGRHATPRTPSTLQRSSNDPAALDQAFVELSNAVDAASDEQLGETL
jgi:hypothetical protein